MIEAFRENRTAKRDPLGRGFACCARKMRGRLTSSSKKELSSAGGGWDRETVEKRRVRRVRGREGESVTFKKRGRCEQGKKRQNRKGTSINCEQFALSSKGRGRSRRYRVKGEDRLFLCGGERKKARLLTKGEHRDLPKKEGDE